MSEFNQEIKKAGSAFGREKEIIMHCISQYRCLRTDQLIELLKDKKDAETTEKIINSLVKAGRVFRKDSYIKARGEEEPDQRMISAFWALICLFNQLKDFRAHYPAKYPSSIYFLKPKEIFELIPILKDGDEDELFLTEQQMKNYQNPNDLKFIVAFEDTGDDAKNEARINACIGSVSSINLSFLTYKLNTNARGYKSIEDYSFYELSDGE